MAHGPNLFSYLVFFLEVGGVSFFMAHEVRMVFIFLKIFIL